MEKYGTAFSSYPFRIVINNKAIIVLGNIHTFTILMCLSNRLQRVLGMNVIRPHIISGYPVTT
jgi:hypothetical protein